MTKSKKPDELLPTRATLLERLKNFDDSKSWQEFFDTYWNLIYGVSLKSGLSAADAEDVVQETVIHAAKHIKDFKYDPSRSFKAWLLIKTRWCIIDRFCKRGPVAPFQPLPGDTTTTDLVEKVIDSAAGQVLEALWEAEWEKNLAEAAIARVKPRPRPAESADFRLLRK